LSLNSVSSKDLEDSDDNGKEHLLPKNDVSQQVAQLTFDYPNETGLIMRTKFVYINDFFPSFQVVLKNPLISRISSTRLLLLF
jgi:hypothetical protein